MQRSVNQPCLLFGKVRSNYFGEKHVVWLKRTLSQSSGTIALGWLIALVPIMHGQSLGQSQNENLLSNTTVSTKLLRRNSPDTVQKDNARSSVANRNVADNPTLFEGRSLIEPRPIDGLSPNPTLADIFPDAVDGNASQQNQRVNTVRQPVTGRQTTNIQRPVQLGPNASTSTNRQNRQLPADQQQANTITQISDPQMRPNGQRVQRENQRQAEVEPGLASDIAAQDDVDQTTTGIVQNDPEFAAPGIGIGSFRLTFGIEGQLGYTTNQEDAALGDGGAVWRSVGQFTLRSQWSRHELSLTGNGEYLSYLNSDIDPDRSAQLEGALRLDLIDAMTLTFGSSYNYELEAATSTNLSETTVGRPGVHTYSGFAEWARDAARTEFNLRSSITRTDYEDATLSNGDRQSQGDRNLNSWELSGRIGYQYIPRYKPFLEASYTLNDYDLGVDRNGQNRDSHRLDLRAGLAFDYGEKLNGEFSIGWARQDYVDPGLAALAGLVAGASINWSPYRDTNVVTSISTDFSESILEDNSGSISYDLASTVTHRIRDNLSVDGTVGINIVSNNGLNQNDTTLNLGLGFDYWINRNWAVAGDLTHQRVYSDDPGNRYDDTSILLGVRLQR